MFDPKNSFKKIKYILNSENEKLLLIGEVFK